MRDRGGRGRRRSPNVEALGALAVIGIGGMLASRLRPARRRPQPPTRG